MILDERLFRTLTEDEEDYNDITISDNDIKHCIDTELSANEILSVVKQMMKQDGASKKEIDNLDLDDATQFLIDNFDDDKYSDIKEVGDLKDYIMNTLKIRI